jgi:hypothetical protein
MQFKAEQAGIYIRIVALISLALGLSDAARLLGVQLGDDSPIAVMGLSAFVWLAIFALARLFAAVGLWIKASWGGVLLVGATGVELGLYLAGSQDVQMTMFGFVVRVILLASIALILLLGFRMRRAAAHD